MGGLVIAKVWTPIAVLWTANTSVMFTGTGALFFRAEELSVPPRVLHSVSILRHTISRR
jgi:hypothetical protein